MAGHRLRRAGAVFRLLAIAFLALVIWGCAGERCTDDGSGITLCEPYSAPTLIGDLYTYCFKESGGCEGMKVDLLLYLDTVNLPSANLGNRVLILSSLPTTPIADGNDRLAFLFEVPLPESIDPGIFNETGWKAQIEDAVIEYCKTCYADCGLVPIIQLRGTLEDVVFLYDPADTIGIYITTES
jgi:hypothetical protein